MVGTPAHNFKQHHIQEIMINYCIVITVYTQVIVLPDLSTAICEGNGLVERFMPHAVSFHESIYST